MITLLSFIRGTRKVLVSLINGTIMGHPPERMNQIKKIFQMVPDTTFTTKMPRIISLLTMYPIKMFISASAERLRKVPRNIRKQNSSLQASIVQTIV